MLARLSSYRCVDYILTEIGVSISVETPKQTPEACYPGLDRFGAKTLKPTHRGECAWVKIPQNLRRFSLTNCGIPLFYVFRDKRVSRTQAAVVLPGLRVEPTAVTLMTKVGLCRVPERSVIFDSLVLSSRHDTDVRLRHPATA